MALTLLMIAGAGLAFMGSASAQDERIDANPSDFTTDGEFDITSYLKATGALATAPAIVPGQSINLKMTGFADGDEVTIFIANPIVSLGTYIVEGDKLVPKTSSASRQGDAVLEAAITIPADYREGYAEIIAARTTADLSDRSAVVTVAPVYVTKPGVAESTTDIEFSPDTEQLLTLGADSLAQTGRTTLTYLGLAVVLMLGGGVVLDSVRNRKSV